MQGDSGKYVMKTTFQPRMMKLEFYTVKPDRLTERYNMLFCLNTMSL